jgi:uncharacterized membrane protein YqjE
LLQDIAGNVRSLLRSEVRLAQAKLTERVADLRNPVAALAVGVVLAVHAVGILLVALVHLLATVVAMWAAGAIVSVVVGLAAAWLIRHGARGLTGRHTTPRTTAGEKGNV